MSIRKDSTGSLKIIALAGAEEIGMNMTVYTYEKAGGEAYSILVDCGVGFDSMPGAMVMIPDIRAIKELGLKIEAIIITHAHEDHIGALPYIYHYLQAPIYATPFTCGLLEKKFHYLKNRHYKTEGIDLTQIEEVDKANLIVGEEVPKERKKKINQVRAGDTKKFGPFTIQWVNCTHSVPDSAMLCIETENGIRVVHTGDWKDDIDPLVGVPTDFETLAKFSQKGVHALISDSTNIHEELDAVSEGLVLESLKKLVKDTKTGKFVLTCFASNVARVKSSLEAAKEAGRKVLVLGTSLKKCIEVARELGYIDDSMVIDEKEAKELAPEKVMIISTGSQAEEGSSLWKMAHKTLEAGSVLEKGDTLVFSARVIDGRQHEVRKVINKLVERGIRIIHPWNSDSCIHASGHPTQPDIEKLIKLVNPKFVVPVHSEAEHRVSHIAFAKKLGYKAFNLRNGTIAEICQDEIKKAGTVKTGRIAVDGQRLISVTSDIFVKRKEISDNGFIMITVRLKGQSVGNLLISDYGVYDSSDGKSKKDNLNAIRAALNALLSGRSINIAEKETTKKAIVNEVKKVVNRSIGKNPIIGVHFTL
jgi:ribonuclease J